MEYKRSVIIPSNRFSSLVITQQSFDISSHSLSFPEVLIVFAF